MTKLEGKLDKLGSGATPRGGQEAYSSDGPIALIRSQNVRDLSFSHHGLAYISEKQGAALSSVSVSKNDILLNITGDSVARCCMVDDAILPARVNQHVAIIRPAPTDFDSRFLHYALVGTASKDRLLALASAGATRNALTKRDLENFEVPFPPLGDQREVADILDALDKKIRLNSDLVATLEETARALFQSWFVDFDPVHAKAEGRDPALPSAIAILFPDRFGDDGLPEGWRSASLLDQADWVNGAAYKNMDFVESAVGLPVIKIAELKAGVTIQTKFTNTELGDRYRITDGELLFSWSGNPQTSIDTFIWTGGDAWLNQHIFAVRENGRMSKAILHTMLKWLKPVFTAIAEDKQTTGLGHVTKDDMKRLKLPVGSEALMRAFSQMVEPLFQKQYATTMETRSYIELRDMLLPLLISGELRVPAVARKVAAA